MRVRDGATIDLTAGTYAFRRFNTGQGFTVYTEPGTIIQVTGDANPNSLDLNFDGNGGYLGSANPAVQALTEFRYLGADVQYGNDGGTCWDR